MDENKLVISRRIELEYQQNSSLLATLVISANQNPNATIKTKHIRYERS